MLSRIQVACSGFTGSRWSPMQHARVRSFATTTHRTQSTAQRQSSALFDLTGRVFIITGGGSGLGLSIAQAIAEAGGLAYCLDRPPEPGPLFKETASRFSTSNSPTSHCPAEARLSYRSIDVTRKGSLQHAVNSIAQLRSRLDGVVAAAGINHIGPAVDFCDERAKAVFNVNFHGVFNTAVAGARAMQMTRTKGSIVLIGSMSALIANKGMQSSIYNASKAAVVQLARNLAMEWSRDGNGEEGPTNIRVNAISPGHVLTPMVRQNFEQQPELQQLWASENMLGRLAMPDEFRGAALYLLSDASSFMTGGNLVVDGGHTAW